MVHNKLFKKQAFFSTVNIIRKNIQIDVDLEEKKKERKNYVAFMNDDRSRG